MSETEIESLNLGTMAGELHRNTAGKIDIAIESLLMFLVYASLGLRLWSRTLQRVSLQINDYLIIIATVSYPPSSTESRYTHLV